MRLSRPILIGALLLVSILPYCWFHGSFRSRTALPPPSAVQFAPEPSAAELDAARRAGRALEAVHFAASRRLSPADVAAPRPSAASLGSEDTTALTTLPSPLSPEWADGKFFDFTPEELRAMATRCELRWRLPPFATTPAPLTLDEAGQLGLDGQESAIYDRVRAELGGRFVAQVRALYREQTGDSAAATTLDLPALIDGIRRHTDTDEARATRSRLAAERAGEQEPGDPQSRGPYEQLLRIELAQGDAFEHALAAELGPSLANELRSERGPRFTLTGCGADALYRSERLR